MSELTDAEMALELGNRWAVRVGGSAISSDEYVPTEDEVRHYVSTNGRMPAEWFDRWLVEHDCEVEARGLEKAADIARERAEVARAKRQDSDYPDSHYGNYAHGEWSGANDVATRIVARAQQVREGI